MKNSDDALKQYVALRDAIFAEREQIVARIREMDIALGALSPHGDGSRGAGSRPQNKMSLKEAVLKVIEGKRLTRHEILDAVIAQGYQFATGDPLNSLGVVLYGKSPKFKNHKGRFSV